jgi:hypothetical protein
MYEREKSEPGKSRIQSNTGQGNEISMHYSCLSCLEISLLSTSSCRLNDNFISVLIIVMMAWHVLGSWVENTASGYGGKVEYVE